MSQSSFFSPASVTVWGETHSLAAMRGSATAEPVHLVIALLALPGQQRSDERHPAADTKAKELDELGRVLARCGVNPLHTNRALATHVQAGAPLAGQANTSAGLQALAREAAHHAGHGARVRPAHLLAACCSQPSEHPVSRLLDHALFPRQAVCSLVRSLAGGVSDTPTLDSLGRDLQARARDGRLAPTAGRRAETTRIARVLLRTQRASAMLVGDPGVGRSATVLRLVQRLADLGPGQHPTLAALRIVQLMPGRLPMEKRRRADSISELIRELRASPDLVVFIDDIADPTVEGGDLLHALAPLLEAGVTRLLATATPAVFNAIERHPIVARNLEAIVIEEPSVEETLVMLECFANGLEQHPGFAGGLRIEREAFDAAVRLAHRYLPDARLPGEACRVLESACHAAMLVSLSQPLGLAAGGIRIGRREVAEVVAEAIGQPVDLMLQDDTRRLLVLQSELQERILGQDAAIAAVCAALRRSMAMRGGSSSARRPLSSFLFVGPTGVGKTQLAKCLARHLFGSDEALIALDMSGFKEKHDVARLLGAPPGFRGYDDEQALGAAIRRRPFSVVLFDEIDKAHPEVLDTLLPLLDEGRLVDGRGRHIDFTNAVVVLTSNLGAEAMADAQRKRRVVAFGAPQGSGDALERGVEAMLARVREVLRPELLGRLTDTVVFRPLTTETLDRIAAVMLDELLAELPSSLRQTKVKDEVRAWVVREGTGQGLGAREVRRALEREIIEPLTDRYMEGGFTGWRGIQVVEGSGGPEFKPLT